MKEAISYAPRMSPLLLLALLAAPAGAQVFADPDRPEAWAQHQPRAHGAARRLASDGSLALYIHRREPGRSWPVAHSGGEKFTLHLAGYRIERHGGKVDERRPGDAFWFAKGEYFAGGKMLSSGPAYVYEVQCPPAANAPLSAAERTSASKGRLPRRPAGLGNLYDAAAKAGPSSRPLKKGKCMDLTVRRFSAPAQLGSLLPGTGAYLVLAGSARVEGSTSGRSVGPGSALFLGRADAALRKARLVPDGELVLVEAAAR